MVTLSALHWVQGLTETVSGRLHCHLSESPAWSGITISHVLSVVWIRYETC